MVVPLRASRLEALRAGRARYEPLYCLAIGGVGEVWRGRAWLSDESYVPVAFKRLLPRFARDAQQRSMFMDEARLGLLLRHPNIVHVFDVRGQPEPTLIMEYVEGPSLKHVLDRLSGRDTRMSVRAALLVARELARALSHAHEARDARGRPLQLIHGDVSPHNVLVGVSGEVKLMDFGLSRSTVTRTHRDPNRPSGKHAYLAPEVVVRRPVSQRSDLFSLGVVLWECLTGERLFQGPDHYQTLERVKLCRVAPPSSRNQAVSAATDALVLRLLAREPAARFSGAREVLQALETCMHGVDEEQARLETAVLARLHPSVLAADERSFMPLDGEVPNDAPFANDPAGWPGRRRVGSGLLARLASNPDQELRITIEPRATGRP